MITISTVDGLARRDGVAIVHRLTKIGSEFQREVTLVLAGNSSSPTPLALWHENGALLAWACSHEWRDMQTLEMFTDERHRGRGIAAALACTLTAAGVIDRGEPLAVFSPVTESIARRVGFVDVRRFEHDWRPVR